MSTELRHWLILIGCAASAIFSLWYVRRGRRPEKKPQVVLTEDRIVLILSPGNELSALRSDVASVKIHTNDSGPWGTDLYWSFRNSVGEIILLVPGGAEGEKEMLAELSELPDWNSEEVFKAMTCVNNGEFLCWERKANA